MGESGVPTAILFRNGLIGYREIADMQFIQDDVAWTWQLRFRNQIPRVRLTERRIQVDDQAFQRVGRKSDRIGSSDEVRDDLTLPSGKYLDFIKVILAVQPACVPNLSLPNTGIAFSHRINLS